MYVFMLLDGFLIIIIIIIIIIFSILQPASLS